LTDMSQLQLRQITASSEQ